MRHLSFAAVIMGSAALGATGTAPEPDEHLRALDGPADDELEFSGPGLDGGDDERPAEPEPESEFAGGLDPTTTAAGAGAMGVVLLGIFGSLKRRSARRRYRDLDDEPPNAR